jgi:hypothetical protein
MMGGTAEGARKTIEGLHKAIFDASFNGQISEQLVQLGRLGVRSKTRRPHARLSKIFISTPRSAFKRRKQRQHDAGRGARIPPVRWASTRGLPGRRLAAETPQPPLGRQEARGRQGEDIANATGNEQALTSANQAKDAAFVKADGNCVAGTIQRVAGAKEGYSTRAKPATSRRRGRPLPPRSNLCRRARQCRRVGRAFREQSVKQWASRSAIKGRSGIRGQIQRERQASRARSRDTRGLLNTESEFNPGAVSPKARRHCAAHARNLPRGRRRPGAGHRSRRQTPARLHGNRSSKPGE